MLTYNKLNLLGETIKIKNMYKTENHYVFKSFCIDELTLQKNVQ